MGAIGIKTGDTKAAGNCLLFEAIRNGVTLIGVTLIGVTLGTPGNSIAATGPVETPRPELGLQPILSKES